MRYRRSNKRLRPPTQPETLKRSRRGRDPHPDPRQIRCWPIIERLGESVCCIAFDLRNWRLAYAALPGGVLLRSDDGGRTWQTG